MTNINKAISLTSYLVALPRTPYMVISIILIGLLFGIATQDEKALESGLMDGLLLLTFPAILSAVVVKILLRRMPFRRIIATALAGEIVYMLAYSLSFLLVDVNEFWSQLVIIVGSSVVFILWYVIARFIFILKYRSILFAMIQLLLYLVFLGSHQAIYFTDQSFIDYAAKFYISAFILFVSISIFFYIINAPMKKNLGIRSTDAMSYFFSQWLYHNKDMESAFEKVGEDAKTIVSVMGFKRKDDTIFFVTPCVHYGPFGNLGGSEFSYLIAKEMDEKYKSKTFVFHGTVTHDLNPVSGKEIRKILSAVDSSINDAKYQDAKVSISLGQVDECRAQNLRVNNSSIVSLSRAPKLTEDINFGLGLALQCEAEKKSENAMIIDQHNAETGEITSFEPASPVGYRYIQALKSSFGKTKENPLKIGVSFRDLKSGVVGSGGLKLAVFSTDPEYVVVLIDSNGVTPGFRQKIEDSVKEKNPKAIVGVFTTDTHQINMVRGVVNPLEDESTIEVINSAYSEAKKDMKSAKFFADTRWFDIAVIGAKQSIELISTVNSIVAISKFTLPLILIGGLLLLIAVLGII